MSKRRVHYNHLTVRPSLYWSYEFNILVHCRDLLLKTNYISSKPNVTQVVCWVYDVWIAPLFLLCFLCFTYGNKRFLRFCTNKINKNDRLIFSVRLKCSRHSRWFRNILNVLFAIFVPLYFEYQTIGVGGLFRG